MNPGKAQEGPAEPPFKTSKEEGKHLNFTCGRFVPAIRPSVAEAGVGGANCSALWTGAMPVMRQVRMCPVWVPGDGAGLGLAAAVLFSC
ncbi:hypothetical protein [Candidatus Poriferisocius sp.]|uniref:hypothetical protein n=1 Tax=Candidatus Poriferisocius sp. TaxID=3101276 RepID=UPI003B01724F